METREPHLYVSGYWLGTEGDKRGHKSWSKHSIMLHCDRNDSKLQNSTHLKVEIFAVSAPYITQYISYVFICMAGSKTQCLRKYRVRNSGEDVGREKGR